VVLEVPLVTLSLAVIGSAQVDASIHPGELSQLAASVKKKVKVDTKAFRPKKVNVTLKGFKVIYMTLSARLRHYYRKRSITGVLRMALVA